MNGNSDIKGTKKKIEFVLDKMVNVNNSKVDAIRKLFLAMESDNYDLLFKFLKEKEKAPKQKNALLWVS